MSVIFPTHISDNHTRDTFASLLGEVRNTILNSPYPPGNASQICAADAKFSTWLTEENNSDNRKVEAAVKNFVDGLPDSPDKATLKTQLDAYYALYRSMALDNAQQLTNEKLLQIKQHLDVLTADDSFHKALHNLNVHTQFVHSDKGPFKALLNMSLRLDQAVAKIEDCAVGLSNAQVQKVNEAVSDADSHMKQYKEIVQEEAAAVLNYGDPITAEELVDKTKELENNVTLLDNEREKISDNYSKYANELQFAENNFYMFQDALGRKNLELTEATNIVNNLNTQISIDKNKLTSIQNDIDFSENGKDRIQKLIIDEASKTDEDVLFEEVLYLSDIAQKEAEEDAANNPVKEPEPVLSDAERWYKESHSYAFTVPPIEEIQTVAKKELRLENIDQLMENCHDINTANHLKENVIPNLANTYTPVKVERLYTGRYSDDKTNQSREYHDVMMKLDTFCSLYDKYQPDTVETVTKKGGLFSKQVTESRPKTSKEFLDELFAKCTGVREDKIVNDSETFQKEMNAAVNKITSKIKKKNAHFSKQPAYTRKIDEIRKTRVNRLNSRLKTFHELGIRSKSELDKALKEHQEHAKDIAKQSEIIPKLKKELDGLKNSRDREDRERNTFKAEMEKMARSMSLINKQKEEINGKIDALKEAYTKCAELQRQKKTCIDRLKEYGDDFSPAAAIHDNRIERTKARLQDFINHKDDNKKDHNNTTEYENMINALNEANSCKPSEMIEKLDNLQRVSGEYLRLKGTRTAFATTLRHTRLNYAREIQSWCVSAKEALQKSSSAVATDVSERDALYRNHDRMSHVLKDAQDKIIENVFHKNGVADMKNEFDLDHADIQRQRSHSVAGKSKTSEALGSTDPKPAPKVNLPG